MSSRILTSPAISGIAGRFMVVVIVVVVVVVVSVGGHNWVREGLYNSLQR
jgi:hypothetical protein